MNCQNCGIKNDLDNNYCKKCGYKLNVIDVCEVCREKRLLEPLTCGHSFCRDCLNSVLATNNKICPKCRKTFDKCNKCFNYKMLNNRCLHCNNHDTIFICSHCNFVYDDIDSLFIDEEDNTLFECENCLKEDVELLEINKNQIDIVKCKDADLINPRYITCCKLCFCDRLETIDNKYLCLNCNQFTNSPIKIPTKFYKKIPKLKKEQVNPSKMKICENCFSPAFYFDTSIRKNRCLNCEKKDIEGLVILKEYKKYFKTLNKDFINPGKIKLCNICYNHRFNIVFEDNKEVVRCGLCNNKFDSAITIFEKDRNMYPIKYSLIINNSKWENLFYV